MDVLIRYLALCPFLCQGYVRSPNPARQKEAKVTGSFAQLLGEIKGNRSGDDINSHLKIKFTQVHWKWISLWPLAWRQMDKLEWFCAAKLPQVFTYLGLASDITPFFWKSNGVSCIGKEYETIIHSIFLRPFLYVCCIDKQTPFNKYQTLSKQWENFNNEIYYKVCHLPVCTSNPVLSIDYNSIYTQTLT